MGKSKYKINKSIDESHYEGLMSSMRYARNRLLFFLLFIAYSLLSILGTTDKMLFMELPIKMPLLNIELPLLAFYNIMPLFLLVLYFNLLYTFRSYREFLIATEIHHPKAIDSLPIGLYEGVLLKQDSFHRNMRFVLRFFLYVFPVLVLTAFWFRFADYQDLAITAWHFVAIIIAMLLGFYFREVLYQGKKRKWFSMNFLSLASLTFLAVISSYTYWVIVPISKDQVSLTSLGSLNSLEISIDQSKWGKFIKRKQWFLPHIIIRGEVLVLFDKGQLEVRQEVNSNKALLFWTSVQNRQARHFRLSILEKCILFKINFQKSEFQYANLRHVELQGGNLIKANLQHADLTLANLQETNFTRANLQRAFLTQAQLQGADLTQAQLQRADLSEAKLQGADLTQAELQRANLSEANFQKTNLTQANFQGANLSRALFQKANLTQAKLQEARLGEAKFQRADLSQANLNGALLLRAKFQEANLSQAKLQGANLIEAELQGAKLTNTELQGANLIEAKLQGANLTQAQLQGADLSRAELQGAFLWRAQFQGANLTDAQLQGAVLTGAKLQGSFLLRAKLQGALAPSSFFGDYKFSKRKAKKTNLIGIDSKILTQEKVDQLITDLQKMKIKRLNKKEIKIIKKRLQSGIDKEPIEYIKNQPSINLQLLTVEDFNRIEKKVTEPKARARMGLAP